MNWKKKVLTYVIFLGLIFAKNTRLQKIEIPKPKDEVNLAQDGYIFFFCRKVFLLLKVSLRISSIHEKSKVICTLKDRFTDCPQHSLKEKCSLRVDKFLDFINQIKSNTCLSFWTSFQSFSTYYIIRYIINNIYKFYYCQC